MAFKVVICAFAMMVQAISGQSIGCGCSTGYSSISSSNAISSSSSALSSGGGFPVTSIGPISPTGIAVDSECDLAGTLDVQGQMPFLSCVEFQENLPTTGSGCVDYSCGTCGNVGITSVQGGSYLGGCGCNV